MSKSFANKFNKYHSQVSYNNCVKSARGRISLFTKVRDFKNKLLKRGVWGFKIWAPCSELLASCCTYCYYKRSMNWSIYYWIEYSLDEHSSKGITECLQGYWMPGMHWPHYYPSLPSPFMAILQILASGLWSSSRANFAHVTWQSPHTTVASLYICLSLWEWGHWEKELNLFISSTYSGHYIIEHQETILSECMTKEKKA